MNDKAPPSIQYIGSGRYADIFRISNGRFAVICKLGFYRDTTLKNFADYLTHGNTNQARLAKNADAIQIANAFGVLTNQLVTSTSPHFVVVYANIDGKHLVRKFAEMIPMRMRSATPTQLKYNNLCFMEQFSSDLTQYIQKARLVNDDTVRGALFGVLYTLAALQATYPGFRHNDLSTNNVLVKRLHTPSHLVYHLKNQGVYYLVSTPILVALADYDFVHVPGVLENERVASGKYKVTTVKNRTYDTHFFLKTVSKVCAKKNTVPHTKAFLSSLPFQTQDRLDTSEVLGMDPISLLKHPYFAPIRRVRKPSAPPGKTYHYYSF